MWNPEEKKRLLWLTDDSNLTKIDPKKIEVHYKDSATKSGEYTITSTAAYFGDVLQVRTVFARDFRHGLFLLPARRRSPRRVH